MRIALLTLAIAAAMCAAGGFLIGWGTLCYWLSGGAFWGLVLAVAPFLLGVSYSLARLKESLP